MAQVSTGFVASGAVELDGTTDVLSLLRNYLWFKPHMLRTDHTGRYVRQMLAGDRAMPLHIFIKALWGVKHLGDRVAPDMGREWVRRILDTLARPFGLSVVPADDNTPPADIRTEVLEANEAVSRAFVAVHDTMRDGLVTAEERATVEQMITYAKQELDDIVQAVRS